MSVNDDDDAATQGGKSKKAGGEVVLTRGCKVLGPAKTFWVDGRQGVKWEAAALLACQLKGKFDIR